MTTLFVPAHAAGRGGAGGHDVPPGPAPRRPLPDRLSTAQASLGWYLRCKWPVLSHCPVLSRRSWWGGEGRCRTLPSARSFSWQRWAPARFVSLGSGFLLGSGVAPALLEAAPPPTTPGRCQRACQQGRDESWSSDWPLRHRRPLLPAKGRVFFLVLDRLCGFYKLSSFISFQALVFQQGENLQEGNFPLGSCNLAQLGLGEGGNRPRG